MPTTATLNDDIELQGLNDYKIAALPSSAYYIPNFLSQEEEVNLLHSIQSRPVRDWTELSRRRLQVWPSRLTNNKLVDEALPRWLTHPCIPRMLSYTPQPREPAGVASAAADPPNKQYVKHIFASSPHLSPNHVLINEYEPGQGIMPHEDGPAYFPVVATVSLGAAIVLDIYEKDPDGTAHKEQKYRILQEPRSLLITTEDLYKSYLHGIRESLEDRDLGKRSIANWDLLGNQENFAVGSYHRKTRTSLTFRDVLQIFNPSKLFPGIANR